MPCPPCGRTPVMYYQKADTASPEGDGGTPSPERLLRNTPTSRGPHGMPLPRRGERCPGEIFRDPAVDLVLGACSTTLLAKRLLDVAVVVPPLQGCRTAASCV